ncbi:hypothetical protein BJ138DRAFT_1168535 [Hygrophoropsis aurantiaca]|uniref:Uncharacterized protein n=1 Tax=Hygrophoropsis aurantiaca TaxID=72124 RepID=A0ACB7ZS10_9AGAM|nr:hypothetical protein BJ138DRAFT_1168535 [Hygrophoropsis aurantiaca]
MSRKRLHDHTVMLYKYSPQRDLGMRIIQPRGRHYQGCLGFHDRHIVDSRAFFQRYGPPFKSGSQLHVQAHIIRPLQWTRRRSVVSASIELRLSHEFLENTSTSATFPPDLRSYTLLRDSELQRSGAVHMAIVTVDFNRRHNIVAEYLFPKAIPVPNRIGSIALETIFRYDAFPNRFHGGNSDRIRI